MNHEHLIHEDELLHAYLALEAERAALNADYGARLKELWARLEAAHEKVRSVQPPLFKDPPLPPPDGDVQTEEPSLITCPACAGDGQGPEAGDECKRCMGTGRIVPQPSLSPCGHPSAASLNPDGTTRPCVLCADEAREEKKRRKAARLGGQS